MEDNCRDLILDVTHVSRINIDRSKVGDGTMEYDLNSHKIIVTTNGDAKDTGTGLSDTIVTEAVKKLLQGRTEASSRDQHSSRDGDDVTTANVPPGHRFYNWNTTHFYPDVHKVDVAPPSCRLQQRRHSEPDFFRLGRRAPQPVSSEAATSSCVSSASNISADVDDNEDSDEMPLTELSVWVAAGQDCRSQPEGSQAVIVDLSSNSSSNSDDENSGLTRKLQSNPMSVTKRDGVKAKPRSEERTKLAASEKSGLLWKADSSSNQVTIDLIDGGINRLTVERPSIRLKDQADKRREFVRQRCRSYGWDLGSGVDATHPIGIDAGPKPVKSFNTPRTRTSISRSQEDIRYIEPSPIEWSVRGAGDLDGSVSEEAHIDVRNRIRLFELSSSGVPGYKGPSVAVPEKNRVDGQYIDDIVLKNNSVDSINDRNVSSFQEKIVDSVSPHGKRSMVNDKDRTSQHERQQNVPNSTGIFITSNPYVPKKMAVVEVENKTEHKNSGHVLQQSKSKQPSDKHNGIFLSNLDQSVSNIKQQKASLDAKSIVEEERLKYEDYKRQFHMLHKSGSEIVSEKNGQENNDRFQCQTNVKSTSKPQKIIPPDDYEYILRKIHHSQHEISHDDGCNEKQNGNSCVLPEGNKLSTSSIQNDRLLSIDQAEEVPSMCVKSFVKELNNSYARNISQHSNRQSNSTQSSLCRSQLHQSAEALVQSENQQSGRGACPLVERRPQKPDLIPSPTVTVDRRIENKNLNIDLDSVPIVDLFKPSVRPMGRQETIFPLNMEEQKPSNHDMTYNSDRNLPKERPSSFTRPQSASAKLHYGSVTEKHQKPPVVPREDFSSRPANDLWRYNSTYAPTSPEASAVSKADDKIRAEVLLTGRWSTPVKQPAPAETIGEMLKYLDDDDLPPPPSPLLHEQYRFSIQEPCHRVQPEHLDANQNVPMYYVDKYSDSIRLQHQTIQAPVIERSPFKKTYLTDDGLSSFTKPVSDANLDQARSTVFSVTGYHRGAEVSVPSARPPVQEPFYSRVKDLSDHNLDIWNLQSTPWHVYEGGDRSMLYSNGEVEAAPYSDLSLSRSSDKRRPIVACREVETALNMDCNERYFYCSGERMNQNEPTGKHGYLSDIVYDGPIYQNYPVPNDYADYGHLWSDYSTNQQANVDEMTLNNRGYVDDVCTGLEYNEKAGRSAVMFDNYVPDSPTRSLPVVYKHVAIVSANLKPQSRNVCSSPLVSQENSVPENRVELSSIHPDAVNSQRASRIDPVIFHNSPTATRFLQLNGEVQATNQTQRFTSADLNSDRTPDSVRVSASRLVKSKSDLSERSDSHKKLVKLQSPSVDKQEYFPKKSVETNRVTLPSEVNTHINERSSVNNQAISGSIRLTSERNSSSGDDESQPVSVADIKAKLFGYNEERARKLFGLRSMGSLDSSSSPAAKTPPPADSRVAMSVKSCPTNSPLTTSVRAPWCKPQNTSDDLLVDYISHSNSTTKKRSYIQDELTDLERTYESLQLYAEDVRYSPTVQSRTCQTSVPTLAENQDTSNVKRLSISNVRMLEDIQMKMDKQCPSLEYTKEWLANDSNRSTLSSSENTSGLEASAMVSSTGDDKRTVVVSSCGSQPRKVADDMAVRRLRNEAISQSNSEVHTPSNVAYTNTVVSSTQQTGSCQSMKSNSFLARSEARRSLPVMSDKDVERWYSILSRLPRDENSSPVSDSGSKLIHSTSVTNLPHSTSLTIAVKVLEPVEPPSVNRIDHVLPNLSASIDPYSMPPNTSEVIVDREQSHLRKSQRGTVLHDFNSRNELHSKSKVRGQVIEGVKNTITVDSNNLDLSNLKSVNDRLGEYSCSPENTAENKTLQGVQRMSVSEAKTLLVADKQVTEAPTNEEVRKPRVTTAPETAEERILRMQKLREQWFKDGDCVQEEHMPKETRSVGPSSCHSASNASSVDLLPPPLNTSSTSLTVISMDTKPQKSLYVSPLIKSSAGMVLANSQPTLAVAMSTSKSLLLDNVTKTSDSGGLSKRSSLEITLPASFTGSKENLDNSPDSKSPLKQVTGFEKIPSVNNTEAGMLKFNAMKVQDRKLPDLSLKSIPSKQTVMSPGIVTEDAVTVSSSRGGHHSTETRTEKFTIEPRKFEATKKFEKTVEQPTKTTFESESEKIRNECEVSSEHNMRVTRQSVETKTERVYRMESKSRLVGNSPLMLSGKYPSMYQDRVVDSRPPCQMDTEKLYDISDGEMTDATDITLDAMVGANQGWRSASEAYEFSDAEFLSSANVSARYVDTTAVLQRSTRTDTAREVTNRSYSSSVATKSVDLKNENDRERQAAIDEALAEMKIYRREKKKKQSEEEDSAERRRSIKELVCSFEGMASPFMRARPRSMEIQSDSSTASEEDTLGSPQAAKTKKKSQLKCSSSFKESSQSGTGGPRKTAKKLTR